METVVEIIAGADTLVVQVFAVRWARQPDEKGINEMRHLKIAGLAFASMLVMSMALAGTASAALLWLVCLEGSGLTKYENSKCLKAASGGKWQSVGVTKEVTVKILVISILLTDPKTAIGKVVANCPNEGSRGEGVVKANGEGEVRVAEYTAAGAKKCTDEEKNCPEFTSVKGVNLPWITNLEEGPGGVHLTTIKPHAGGGQPGWAITCKDIVNVTDECTSSEKEEEKLKLINTLSATELLVAALFERAHEANCTQSKEKTGTVTGILAILLPGGALSINPV